MRNPKKFVGYDRFSWGITATDGPGPAERRINGRRVRFFDYKARSFFTGRTTGRWRLGCRDIAAVCSGSSAAVSESSQQRLS